MLAMRGKNSNVTLSSNLLKLFLNSCETQKINGYLSSNLLRIRLFNSFDGHSRNFQGRRNSRNDDYDDDNNDKFSRNNSRNGRNNYDDDKFSRRNRGNFSARQSSRNGSNDYDDDDKFSGRNRGSFSANQSSRNGRNDFDDDDKFSGRNRGNVSARQSSRNNRNDYDDDDKFSGRDRGSFSARQSSRNGRSDYDDESSKFSGRNRGSFNHGSDRVISGGRQRSQFGGNNVEIGSDYPNGRRRDDGGNKSDDFPKFSDDETEGEKKDYQPSVRELLNSKKDDNFLEKFKLNNEKDNEENKDNEVNSSTTPTQEEKMDIPEGADEIFNKMKINGLIPNAVAMLDGLCKDGLVHEAMKLFGLMREKGSMPEVVVYTAVVDGFCQAHKLDDAIRIFKKMQDNGIIPNAFSYTILIKGLCKNVAKLDDAVGFCFEMLETGHSPNVAIFTGLVHELCKAKGVDDAREFIRGLIQKGFVLDEKAVRIYLDKVGPSSKLVWEAIFGVKKTA